MVMTIKPIIPFEVFVISMVGLFIISLLFIAWKSVNSKLEKEWLLNGSIIIGIMWCITFVAVVYENWDKMFL